MLSLFDQYPCLHRIEYNSFHLETLCEIWFFSSLLIPPGGPFDLAVFEDTLWISDQEHRQLRSVHKRTGKKLQRIHGNIFQPSSIVVVHPLAKPGTERQQGSMLVIFFFQKLYSEKTISEKQ